MREIKFRFWHKGLRKMSKVHGLGVIWEYLSQEDFGIIFHWEDVVKMQYTGLKDKQGNEIWEDDIVEVDPSVGFNNGKNRGYICYSETSGAFWLESQDEGMPILALDCEEQLKVIGNCKENPELLESE